MTPSESSWSSGSHKIMKKKTEITKHLEKYSKDSHFQPQIWLVHAHAQCYYWKFYVVQMPLPLKIEYRKNEY